MIQESDGKWYCPSGLAKGGGPDSPFHPPFNGEAEWRSDDGTCTYCGSLNPEYIIDRVRAKTAWVEMALDKNYKMYARIINGGEPFKQTYRDCPKDATCQGPDDCTHWVTRDITIAKVYLWHFNDAQRSELIQLLTTG